MFKDIKVFNTNESFEYNYKIDDGLLLFSIENGNESII